MPLALVSVIIVNYNGRSDLRELFDSLKHQTRPADEVILVDNASTDGSADYVRQHFPWVQVIALTEMLGLLRATMRAGAGTR